VKITYFSSCLNQKKEETNICKGLRVGDTVTFEAKIEVTSCPRNPNEWNQTIQIYPVGLNDALIIDLEMICECDCEKPWNEQTDSDYCEGRGTYECGICSCYGNYYGRRCECDAKEANPAEEEQSCIRGNDTKVCSGRGACRSSFNTILSLAIYNLFIYYYFCFCLDVENVNAINVKLLKK
jgi:protocadherin alpha